jgi:sarcosine oxidase subunit beta
VIEKRPALATLTTPVSAGAFRLQFDNREELELVAESIGFFDSFTDQTGLKDDDIQVRHQGYLFVTTTEAAAKAQEHHVSALRGWGLNDVELLDARDARARFPYLSPTVLNARFRQGDGWVEPRRVALGLARASGAEFVLGQAVTGFQMSGDRVTGVRTQIGSIDAGAVVIAAGPLSGPLAGLAGLDLPLATVRRQKLVLPDVPEVPQDAPMTIEVETGAHWRPGLGGALGLWTADAHREPPLDEVPTSSDFAFGLLNPQSDHALARIAPFWSRVWESSRLQWFIQAGQYTYTPDHRPLLGPTQVPGLVVNTGYSGHGIMGSIGGSRRVVDTVIGKLASQDNPFRPDRKMRDRVFDVL